MRALRLRTFSGSSNGSSSINVTLASKLRAAAIECGVQSRLRISVGPHRAGLATAGDVKRVVGTPLPPADCDDSRVLLRVPLRICIALGVPGVCLEAACADDLKVRSLCSGRALPLPHSACQMTALFFCPTRCPAHAVQALLESDTAWEVKLASVMLWVANSADRCAFLLTGVLGGSHREFRARGRYF